MMKTRLGLKRLRIVGLVMLISAGFFILGLRMWSGLREAAAQKMDDIEMIPAVVAVDVVCVAPEQWEEWNTYYGQTRAAQTQSVTSLLRETVESVRVNVGDRVEEGQVIVTFLREEYNAAGQAKAAAYQEAKTNYERLSRLAQSGGVAQADVDRAHTLMQTERAAVQQSQSQLKRAELHAKISGVVTARDVEPGEIAEPGMSLLTIEDVSQVEAEVLVSAKDAARVGPETPVRIIAGGETRYGRIKRVSLRAKEASGLYPIFVALDPESGILPGISVEASFQVRRDAGSVVIPSSAVVRRGENQFVYVAVESPREKSEKTASLQKIEASGGRDGKFLIASGLAPGDLLIISGSRGLYDGAPISFNMAFEGM